MTLRPEKNLHIHKYVCLGLKQLFSPIYYWQCARDRAKNDLQTRERFAYS